MTSPVSSLPRWFLPAGLFLFLISGLEAQTTVPLTVQSVLISTSTPSLTIPSGFTGFAINYASVTQVTGYTNSASTNTAQYLAFIQYMKNLADLNGPPGIRSGGHTADFSYWWSNSSDTNLFNYYNQTLQTNQLNPVSNNVLQALALVVSTMQSNFPGSSVPFIMTLNLGGYDSYDVTNFTGATNPAPSILPMSHLVTAISGAMSSAGITNPIFEIGNEVDNYSETQNAFRNTNLTPSGWSSAMITTNMLAFKTALTNALTNNALQFVGPAYSHKPGSGRQIDQSPLPSSMATNVGLSLISLHNYPHGSSTAYTTNPPLGVALMLTASQDGTVSGSDTNPMSSGAESGPFYAPYMGTNPKVSLRIDECNSFGGGCLGSDNAFAAALWGADTCASYARSGMSGVNFNSGQSAGIYEPLHIVTDANGNVTGLQAQPLYYGMYFFALAAQNGGKIITATNVISDQFFSPGTQAVTNASFTNAITKPVPASTYYFLDKLNNLRVLVINRSNRYATNSGNLTFNFWPTNSTSFSSNGTLLSLSAVPAGTTNYATLTNSLYDTNTADITIGGQSFNSTNGVMNTNAFVTTTISRNTNGMYSFSVPYASAMILTLKASSATITLGNTNQTYSGLAESVTTSVAPSDAGTAICTYSSGAYPASTNPPTNAGTYDVSATLSNTFYNASTNGILSIGQAASTITISTNSYPYTGNPIPATVTTAPANLPVICTYSGATYPASTNPPTAVGTYAVTAVVSSTASYTGATAIGSLVIDSIPTIISNPNPQALLGQNFTYQIVTANGATNFSASNLPTGLSLNTNTGIITGTISTLGSQTFTVSATDSIGTSSAIVVVGVTNSVYTFTNAGVSTWTCPTNVNSVQVQCWGGGGAGGSALKNGASGYGGGGAGGTYAGKSYPVLPGTTYTVNVGSGGVSPATNAFTNGQFAPSGGDSWFNSNNIASSLILAKGGQGGACALGTTVNVYAIGGAGTTNGSIGDVLFAGGNGSQSSSNAYAGGGGGSAGPATNGNSATPNSGVGATAVPGGGNGGAPNAASGSSGVGQSPTIPPGGGGGGARCGGTTPYLGGSGSPGQVVLTITNLAAAVTLGNLSQTYSGLAKQATVSTTPSNTPVTVTYSNALYSNSTNPPTNAGSYTVFAATTNSTYAGSTTGTLLISPASPVITIYGATNDPYNGIPYSVSTTISPGGIPVITTYNGSTLAPSAIGTYSIVASNSADTINSNWLASSTNAILTIYDPSGNWRQYYYGTTNNSGAAASTAVCGNGLNNNANYTFGINPTNPATSPLLSISNESNNSLTLSFTAQAAGPGPGYSGLSRYYNLEATTNLTNSNEWNPIPGYSNILGSNQVISLSTNASIGPKCFYRLKAWLQ